MPCAKFRRRLFQWLRGKTIQSTAPLKAQTEAFLRTQLSVRIFYATSLFLALEMSSWVWRQYSAADYTRPLWPLFGLNPGQHPGLLLFVLAIWTMGTFLATVQPRWALARGANALGIFYVVTIINSDVNFSHNVFALMFVSLIFAFFPNSNTETLLRRRAERQYYVLVFWAAQFVVCTFYFLTGIWKVRSLVACAVLPNMNCELSHKVLTNIAAQELILYNKFAPLHQILFTLPWIGFFAYAGTIWLHAVSLFFPFRPKTHVLFGTLRVIFHLGTLLLFGVDFSLMTLPVLLIFLFSPFQTYDRPVLVEMIDLPPFGFMARWFGYRDLQSPSRDCLICIDTLRVSYGLLSLFACMRAGWAWKIMADATTDKWLVHASFVTFLFGTIFAALRPQQLILRLVAFVGCALVMFVANGPLQFEVAPVLVIFSLALVILPVLKNDIFESSFAWLRIALAAYVTFYIGHKFFQLNFANSPLWTILVSSFSVMTCLTSLGLSAKALTNESLAPYGFVALAATFVCELCFTGWSIAETLLVAIPLFVYYPLRKAIPA